MWVQMRTVNKIPTEVQNKFNFQAILHWLVSSGVLPDWGDKLVFVGCTWLQQFAVVSAWQGIPQDNPVSREGGPWLASPRTCPPACSSSAPGTPAPVLSFPPHSVWRWRDTLIAFQGLIPSQEGGNGCLSRRGRMQSMISCRDRFSTVLRVKEIPLDYLCICVSFMDYWRFFGWRYQRKKVWKPLYCWLLKQLEATLRTGHLFPVFYLFLYFVSIIRIPPSVRKLLIELA